MNLIDCHTHTNFSPDGSSTAEQMCVKAMELGLTAYAITDHCDCNFWYPAEHYFKDTQGVIDLMMYGSGKYANDSIAEQLKLKEKYYGKLNLLCGIELGQPLQNPDKAEEMVSNSNLDFIIGSHHQNMGKDDFYYIDYKKMDTQEMYFLIEEYFTQILDMCKWGKFDVLGHLTYPLRYICGDCGIEFDLKRYDAVIEEIFKVLVQNGKGIEINTSGLRQKYGRTLPELKYVQLFKEKGGEIITIGSDAHCSDDLGKGISEGIEIAKQAGFEYISYFKNRKPQFLKI